MNLHERITLFNNDAKGMYGDNQGSYSIKVAIGQ
ncbi:MAG: hypothetical protein F6K18_09145 [Okeania sp. SIO2C2]|nr:hypothetical protein [Okeania sp. SIO2C2]